jgi:hypothetical protein
VKEAKQTGKEISRPQVELKARTPCVSISVKRKSILLPNPRLEKLRIWPEKLLPATAGHSTTSAMESRRSADAAGTAALDPKATFSTLPKFGRTFGIIGLMTQADRIRQYVLDHYVAPARAKGRAEITIRAGDVHQEMGLANRMPAVCSAIDSNKFNQLARVIPIGRRGPANGANVFFQFRLGPTKPAVSQGNVSFGQQAKENIRRFFQTLKPEVKSVATGPGEARRPSDVDLTNAIVLVSCVSTKLDHPAPARSLYTSALFCKARDLVEASGARWFVLSSLYGLVAPDTEIAPYDYTLNSLGVVERRKWADKVLAKLIPKIADERRVVMFAGQRYREFLVDPLRRRGIAVDVPMEHLRQGEQLAWLSGD